MATVVCKIYPYEKKDGTSKLYLLITNGNKKKKIDIGYSVKPEHFADGLVTKDTKEPKRLRRTQKASYKSTFSKGKS